ncbi:corrinoid ABC transporter substrate-binding protein [bacterium BMS3Bbin14]|nr:corrinoid ABC transporter substrate-binding protein [bacterium BMS3Abin13]GBE51553.1 corrinoid ABC transporter substrate-binding protein [bacterium BMS3Bbin14]
MNRKRRKMILGLPMVMALFFIVCSGLPAVAGPGLSGGGGSAGKPCVIVDRSGNRIVIKKPFTRIISLYGAHTENLFSLGLDQEVIGVSRHEAFPPLALIKPAFSYHDDAERFLAARPDLVLIRPMIARGYGNLVRKLRQAGITVVSLQPTTIGEVYSYWRDLGKLTGREKQAEKMVSEFKAGLARIHALVQKIPPARRKQVYFEAIHSKMKTFSPSSIAIFALKTAGGINVAGDARSVRGTNIAAYGKEHILARADEIDVYLAQKGAMNHINVRRIVEEGGFGAIKAVRNGQVYIIDEKIVSRPTLRLLDGIYEIGRFLYPRVFNDVSVFLKIPRLTRAQFSEMFVKMTNMPLKTPDYWHDIQRRSATRHKYGSFRDVDYTGHDYKFIETAAYRGIFANTSQPRFYPHRPITRRAVAYAIFVDFDLPETKPVAIRDIRNSDPMYEQIRTAVGLGIMKLDQKGDFLPDNPVSGQELFRAISQAIRITKSGR